MNKWVLLLLMTLPLPAVAELYVTIIEGLGGTDQYVQRFAEQTAKLRQATGMVTGNKGSKVLSGQGATRKNILTYGKSLVMSVKAGDRTILILVGHGSYDGHEYKFNIPGPDLTSADIGTIMSGWQAQRQLLLVFSSASGAILKDLQKDNRIIITATRSGNERNAPIFGTYFIAALQEATADTDKNDAISATEAYAYAERLTKDYYQGEGRLATEHPQLQGAGAGQFQLSRLTPVREPGSNPELARLDQQRQQLDQAIADLRLHKADYRDNDEYLNSLQDLLLQLSKVEEQIEALQPAPGPAGTTEQP